MGRFEHIWDKERAHSQNCNKVTNTKSSSLEFLGYYYVANVAEKKLNIELYRERVGIKMFDGNIDKTLAKKQSSYCHQQ